MENKNYIVAIDLGSSSVTVAAGSKDPDGKLNIIDVVSKPLEGMSCGEVTNIEQVTTAAREAVTELETNLGIKVTDAYAGISGQDIKCADSSYFVYVSGEDHEICEEDVVKLHESMTSLQPPEGICILDRTPQKYVIDSREETMQPVGRFGQQLEATFNFTLGNRSSIERLGKAFLRLGIRQNRLFTNAQASAAAVLTDDEKELGAAIIDIGAGCTDICIWQDNIMRYVGVLPVGSEAINRDIRSIAIPERFIEKLKATHGYAVAGNIPDEKKNQIIKIKGRTPRENKEISFFSLAQIIEARMLDIVENVMEEIKESGYAEKLGSGLVLTGGGAMLNDIEVLFRERTKYDVRVGATDPALVNDASLPVADDMRYTSAIGLMLLGMSEGNIATTGATPVKRSAEEIAKTAPKSPQPEKQPEHQKDEEQPRQTNREEAHSYDEEDEDVPFDSKKSDKPKRAEKPVKEKPAKPEKDKKPKKGLIDFFKDIFEVVDDDEI